MGKLAQKLAAQPLWFQNAYLSSAVKSQVESGNFAECYQTLTDFDYLEAKIKRPEFGVQALITDYDLIDSSKVATHSDDNSHEVETLKLIQGALRLCAHILAEDKTQLAGQLFGRLLSFPQPGIQTLLAQAKQWQDDPWLRPLSPSLSPPGGPLLRTLTGHSDSVNAVAVTPDGKRVISASLDSTLKVWDLADGKEVFTLTGHSDSVRAVAVTPDGKRVISASDDNTLKVWDLADGKEVFTLNAHSSSITAVAVTPDGKRVISASLDNTLKVWDLADGKQLF
ncbi:WD40 repeat domain-containing protein, partial [Scytonema sp. PCC 10023]|uniref:WD40 repeat domain-containing protein n=1 Tax=Scytonema sp. PCC 10023 TaxID=1680591 RepID=UPI0039C615F2